MYLLLPRLFVLHNHFHIQLLCKMTLPKHQSCALSKMSSVNRDFEDLFGVWARYGTLEKGGV